MRKLFNELSIKYFDKFYESLIQDFRTLDTLEVGILSTSIIDKYKERVASIVNEGNPIKISILIVLGLLDQFFSDNDLEELTSDPHSIFLKNIFQTEVYNFYDIIDDKNPLSSVDELTFDFEGYEERFLSRLTLFDSAYRPFRDRLLNVIGENIKKWILSVIKEGTLGEFLIIIAASLLREVNPKEMVDVLEEADLVHIKRFIAPFSYLSEPLFNTERDILIDYLRSLGKFLTTDLQKKILKILEQEKYLFDEIEKYGWF